MAGLIAGFLIGTVASLLGVAGGEFLIPTLVLLLGCDIKLAGSLSLAVSLPTVLMGFMRYSRDRSFSVLGCNHWQLHRRADAWYRAECLSAAVARSRSLHLCCQDLAASARSMAG
jgi:hypothetical protein